MLFIKNFNLNKKQCCFTARSAERNTESKNPKVVKAKNGRKYGFIKLCGFWQEEIKIY